MASILKVDALQGITAAGDITVTSEGGAATQSLQQGLAKVWVNFNGTGTIAARDSLNLSSLTDNGTGQYTVNFSNATQDVNFAAISSCNYRTTTQTDENARTTSAVDISCAIGASGSSVVGHTDKDIVQVAALGDLA